MTRATSLLVVLPLLPALLLVPGRFFRSRDHHFREAKALASPIRPFAMPKNPAPPDTTPPEAVRDLAIEQTGADEGVGFSFTGAADDAAPGCATRYELYRLTNGWDKPDNFLRAQIWRWPLSKWSAVTAKIPVPEAGKTARFAISLPVEPFSTEGKLSGPKFYQSWWMLVAFDDAGNAARSRPVLDMDLLKKSCQTEDCHQKAWPQDSGRHDKHLAGNKMKCVVCHSASVDDQFRLLARHDNKQADVVMVKAPDRAVFHDDEKRCDELCHQPRSWKPEVAGRE